MFKITEIKSWAKRWGYSILKEKDDSENGATYYWSKDDESIKGSAGSVSKVATEIYNHLSNNKWIEHQNKFKENKEFNQPTLSDY